MRYKTLQNTRVTAAKGEMWVDFFFFPKLGVDSYLLLLLCYSESNSISGYMQEMDKYRCCDIQLTIIPSYLFCIINVNAFKIEDQFNSGYYHGGRSFCQTLIHQHGLRFLECESLQSLVGESRGELD